MWKQVGERVKELRMERELSKARFGEMIGVSGQYVGMIEKGAGISAESIVNICTALSVSADYLLFGNAGPANAVVSLNSLKWLTHEQLWIAFDIIKRVAQMITTEGGNEALIQEVLRQQNVSLPL
ncbi:MAG: helix-turn-helix domain-containing protein [Firmicutes bacterium]|nr:helix-turn-helix domain-containing protein [Bacillota bacterium]